MLWGGLGWFGVVWGHSMDPENFGYVGGCLFFSFFFVDSVG